MNPGVIIGDIKQTFNTYYLRHFEISPATGGGGGGIFGLDPENKFKVNRFSSNLVLIMVRMILVNIKNFKLLAFLLLEI